MNIIYDFVKLIGLNLGICYAFFKISNIKKIGRFKLIYLLIVNLVLVYFQCIFDAPIILKLTIITLLDSIILGNLTKNNIKDSIVIVIVSTAVSFITSLISAIITLFFIILLTNLKFIDIIFNIIATFLNLSLLYCFFKIKRLQNGLPFLIKKSQNGFLGIFILVITTIIIFTYFMIGHFMSMPIIPLIFSFILFSIIMVIVIQKTFILYQKQKLQTKTLKEYEKELKEIKQKLETALEEKEKLVKSNHEFYHRQEALKNKLDNLINQKQNGFNLEFSEELCGDIMDRINNLSNEYVQKMHTIPRLIKTGIEEIDDMLEYMQSECEKNNIEFILQVDCDINYIIENFITKSQLETLLGDLIRNSIIAINHSTHKFRSIMVVFGIKDDSYELCILDSGIPFEIITLLNLGLHPATTHKSEGGTGMGFITTFETINSCNASFIINENTNNNYTKSIEIKFDNKHEYVIISNRSENIKKMNVVRRNIVLKNE